MGKELLTDLKYGIFKNWLRTRPKMETNEPNVYPTILGGVSRGFWGPFEALGAQSAIFWHLKTGTFVKSGPSSGIYGSINLKIVFWALLTTLNMPCDGRKAQPKKIQIYRPINATGRTT